LSVINLISESTRAIIGSLFSLGCACAKINSNNKAILNIKNLFDFNVELFSTDFIIVDIEFISDYLNAFILSFTV